jgi:hypothetical protein
MRGTRQNTDDGRSGSDRRAQPMPALPSVAAVAPGAARGPTATDPNLIIRRNNPLGLFTIANEFSSSMATTTRCWEATATIR